MTRIRQPGACAPEALEAFARLVRQGFPTAGPDLPRRMQDAGALGFRLAGDGTLQGIAALKVPPPRYRDQVFLGANADAPRADYRLELGWVYVPAPHRRQGIAADLCRALVAHAADHGLFATTRPGNGRMIGILRRLGFTEAGTAFVRRGEELALYLRPGNDDRP
jgi:RimJ/RimL family protein N-acetyltransferase